MQSENLEAEKKFLGTILANLDMSHSNHLKLLKPEDFSDLRNRVIFEVMIDMDESNQDIDYLSVGERLQSKGITEEIYYVAELTNCNSGVENLAEQARIIKSHSQRRKGKRWE